MIRSNEERERPVEWLRRFAEDRARYALLIEEAGSVAVAAHRLASARCKVQSVPATVPTLSELRAAADDLTMGAGLPRAEHIGVLVADCALAGLPVILPSSYDSAA